MSEFDLRIEVEKTEYNGGDTLSGVLHVQSPKDYTAKAVTVGLGWYTHGFGNGDHGEVSSALLHSGRIIAGRAYALPFSLEIPNGPVTFRGNLVNVEWELSARADIPWKIDPKAEFEIYVTEPNTGELYVPGTPLDELPAWRAQPNSASGGAWLLFILPFLLFGLFALYSAITQFDLFWLIFALGFLLLPGFILFRGLKNTFAEKRIGEVQMEVPARLSPGGLCPIQVAFTPKSSGYLNEIRATLTCQEHATAGSGTNRRTRTHEIAKIEKTSATQQRLMPGQRVESELEFELPADAVLSFYGGDNKVKWTVEVRVDIPGWPDWVETRDVCVVPAT